MPHDDGKVKKVAAGAVLGAVAGGIFGPIGWLVGGIVGAVVGNRIDETEAAAKDAADREAANKLRESESSLKAKSRQRAGTDA